MKFHEAMKAVQEGKEVRFKQWATGLTLSRDDWLVGHFGEREFDSDDWEIHKSPKPLFSFMEVVEGVGNGKRFKRPQWEEGKSFGKAAYGSSYVRINLYGGEPWDLRIEDLEATDWEEVGE